MQRLLRQSNLLHIQGAKMKNINIAIDGPSGAGKSSVAKALSKSLGFLYVDTGAMFRAVALYIYNNNIENDIENNLDNIKIRLEYINDCQHIYLCDKDVTNEIRQEKIGNLASKFATIAPVRNKLLELQRDIASKHNIVMDGRDIGSVVLPNADLKIFLTASVEVRAKRRFDELVEKGINCNYEKIKADIEARDYQDSHRQTAPLVKAKDAIYLDSSNLCLEEVVDKIERILNEKSSIS